MFLLRKITFWMFMNYYLIYHGGKIPTYKLNGTIPLKNNSYYNANKGEKSRYMMKQRIANKIQQIRTSEKG